MIFRNQLNAFKLAVNHNRAGSMIKDIIVYGKTLGGESGNRQGEEKLPEAIYCILKNEKLMNAVFAGLALARNDHRTSKNYDVGVFIFNDNGSGYSFRHRGPLAVEGLRGGQDFGGRGRYLVEGSAALAISVTQLDSIRNGRLQSPELIARYKAVSLHGGMPVFVNSRGDFRSMMMYHYSYEGAVQVAY